MAEKPLKTTRRKTSLLQRMRSNFLTGLIVVAPLLLTIYIIWSIVGFIDNKVVPWLPDAYNPESWLGRDIPGFGVIVFLIVTAIVGTLTKGLVGRQMVRYGESLVDRMPVVRSIYNGLKQMVETIFSQSNMSFKQSCMIEWPRKGIWVVGFVARPVTGEIADKMGETDVLGVFLPTTPNPTSGYLLFMPRRDVIMLDMSIEDAAKLNISGGLILPPTTEEIAARRAPLARTAK